MTCIEFGVNGNFVATGGGNSVKLWDTDSFHLIRELPHPAEVNGLDCHAKTDLLASACEDGITRLWNTRTGECQTLASPNAAPMRFVSFDSSGEKVFGVDATDKMTVWQVTDGTVLAKGISHQYQPTKRLFYCRPVFTRGGTRLITTNDRKLSMWDTTTWSLALSVEMETRTSGLSVDEDGRFIVASTGSTNTALITPKGDAFESKHRLNNARQSSCGDISLQGEVCATASTIGIIQLWNTKTGQPTSNVRHSELLQKVRFERFDGNLHLIACGNDGTLRIWNLSLQSDSVKRYDFGCIANSHSSRTRNGYPLG